MGARLKHLFAKDSQDNIITAKQAVKGLSYFNVISNAKMVLKKSDNTGPYNRSAHFSLIGDHAGEPSLESEEHFVCKQRITSILNYHIANHIPLTFSWYCTHCGEWLTGEWIKRATKVMCEYSGFRECRPDIALLDSNNRVFAVIEVIVTHEPENNVVDFYKDNNIILLEIRIDRGNIEDIVIGDDFILEKLEQPNCVRFFPCSNFSIEDRDALHNLIERLNKKDANWKYWYYQYSDRIYQLSDRTIKKLSFYALFESIEFVDIDGDERYSCCEFIILLIPLLGKGYKYQCTYDDPEFLSGDVDFIDSKFTPIVAGKIKNMLDIIVNMKDDDDVDKWVRNTIDTYINQRIASK